MFIKARFARLRLFVLHTDTFEGKYVIGIKPWAAWITRKTSQPLRHCLTGKKVLVDFAQGRKEAQKTKESFSYFKVVETLISKYKISRNDIELLMEPGKIFPE